MRAARCFMSVIGLLHFHGCASIQDGQLATVLDEKLRPIAGHSSECGLVVSGREVTDYSSPQIGMVALTFENQSQEWIHLESMSIDFGDATKNQAVQFPWGTDLESWKFAVEHRNAIKQHNQDMALFAIFAVGDALSTFSSKGSAVSVAGGMVSTLAMVPSFVNALQPPETRVFFPRGHLLSEPVSVPPGLFAKKWVVMHVPDSPNIGCIDRMVLSYRVKEHGSERVLLIFKLKGSISEWQRLTCQPRPTTFSHKPGA
jgi:hypothetical protein